MPDFRKLFEEVLRQRPDLSEATLSQLIEAKKQRVGAGYLTDGGALFLVASDLGVFLEHLASADLTLKDLYIGATEITILGRMFAIYPLRTYSRRDGSEGQYRRLILFDADQHGRVTVWDDKAQLIDQLKLTADTVIRVTKGYVKAGLDGRPILHVGVRGGIEVVEDRQLTSRIPTIADRTKEFTDVLTSEPYLAVTGILRTAPRVSEFVHDDGRPGSLVQLSLSTASGDREMRVAIWDADPRPFVEAPIDHKVRLVNVRSKVLPHGAVELHGDDGTTLQVVSKVFVTPVVRAEQPPPVQQKVFRVLSVGPPSRRLDGSVSASALVVDAAGNVFTLIARGPAHDELLSAGLGHAIAAEVKPLNPSTMLCDTPAAIRPEAEDPGLPGASSFTCKIRELADRTKPVFLEVIALARSSVQDITTKDGSIVRKAEVTVGDETGETKVVAWRGLAALLERIMPGDRLRLRGLIVQKGRDGSQQLLVRTFSSVERLTSPT